MRQCNGMRIIAFQRLYERHGWGVPRYALMLRGVSIDLGIRINTTYPNGLKSFTQMVIGAPKSYDIKIMGIRVGEDKMGFFV